MKQVTRCNNCGGIKKRIIGGRNVIDVEGWSDNQDNDDDDDDDDDGPPPGSILVRVDELTSDITPDESIVLQGDDEFEDASNDMFRLVLANTRAIVIQETGLNDIQEVVNMLLGTPELVFLSLENNMLTSVAGLNGVLPQSLRVLDLTGNAISDIDELVLPRGVEILLISYNRYPANQFIDKLDDFRRRNPTVGIHALDAA